MNFLYQYFTFKTVYFCHFHGSMLFSQQRKSFIHSSELEKVVQRKIIKYLHCHCGYLIAFCRKWTLNYFPCFRSPDFPISCSIFTVFLCILAACSNFQQLEFFKLVRNNFSLLFLLCNP